MKAEFFELMLDNIPHGIYVLDDHGTYVYANKAYIDSLGRSKETLIGSSVYEFVRRKEIKFCISDIVYREKKSVFMLQDVHLQNGSDSRSFRHLIISNPVFDESGNIQNIIAICTPVNTLNQLYEKAEEDGMIHSYFKTTGDENEDESVIANSPNMKYLLKMSASIAKTDTSVLLTGESGVGKEVLAQYIHTHSLRSKKKMVVINCAALPEQLLEAELFGYEKGAFTGASANGKAGLIEEADGSTLFLDEINSLPMALQGKLLRALETKTIQRIGSTKTKQVDFRILSATNENLERAIEEKRFRPDLYYRLNVIPLQIPPLRERKEDILPLAKLFLKTYNQKYQKNKLFSENTIQKMQDYNWPGNVRELKNFVERIVVMSAGPYIEVPDIKNITDMLTISFASEDIKNYSEKEKQPEEITEKAESIFESGISLSEYVERCERNFVQYALNKTKSTYEAADFLNTSQSAVIRKKKKYNL